MADKLTFAAWCDAAGIPKDTVASLAEATGYKPDEELTEAQFHRAVPLTVEDFLKYAAPGVSIVQRGEFLQKFNLLLEDTITAEDFKAKLATFKAELAPPVQSAPVASKPTRYYVGKCSVLCGKKEYREGERLPADVPEDDIARLVKLGAVVKEK